jgi:hypothetical protein
MDVEEEIGNGTGSGYVWDWRGEGFPCIPGGVEDYKRVSECSRRRLAKNMYTCRNSQEEEGEGIKEEHLCYCYCFEALVEVG